MLYYLSNKDLSNCDIVDFDEDDRKYYVSYNSCYLTNEFLYYVKICNEFVFSFDFFEIVNLLRKNQEISLNIDVINFFVDKGYSPMDYTFINGVYKLPNITKMCIDKQSFGVFYKLNEYESKNNFTDVDILKKSIYKCFTDNGRNVILFSGGFDSTLIALLGKLKYKKEQLELVTTKFLGVDFEPNRIDIEYSKKIAEVLDLNFRIINVDIDAITSDELDELIFIQPNTSHLSLLFYPVRDFYQRKNMDCTFISGQQADSILNIGSTASLKYSSFKVEGLGELFRRLFCLMNPCLSKIIFCLLNPFCSKKYYQLFRICGFKYLPWIKDENKYITYSRLYKAFVKRHYESRRILSSFHLFYLYTHLSGSDASGVLSFLSKNNYPLPFNDLRLVWHFVNKKYTFMDIITPKRPIVDLLKKHVELWDILVDRPNTPNISGDMIFNKISIKLDLEKKYRLYAKEYGIPNNIPFNYQSFHIARCLDKIYSCK